ncbi:tetratricopeptide repeat protein [Clostridium tagluense]|uniref:tetratricopeptide repeat protein n=1 Tax=Clostridium tagluense TaxID=360422 RepID=UPI001C6E8779|nr:tetratricopeptide repeat protein [Clostridium tagluense]MBW9157005.1 tetratricopeptide repeat protein [Clostridium tagluense]WLC64992.1 tetratricopeptide repeat protein [Clostridium tagluense]
MMEIKKKKYERMFINILIIAISYYMVLRFIFPKYFMPLIAHHSDMIDYAYDSNGMGIIDYIKAPRGVGQFIISLFSFSNYQITTFFSVIITLLNIYLLFIVAKEIFNLEKTNYFYKIVYSILVFAHPGFYINYTFDIYSSISLTFLLLLLLNHYHNSNSNKMTIDVILILLCGLSKETYLVSIIAFFFFNGLFIEKTKEDKIMIIVSIVMAGLMVYWNKNIGSAFVSLSSSQDSAYYTSFEIKSLIKTFLYYVKDWGNIVTVVLFVVVGITVLKNREKLFKIVMLLAMNLSAYIPYAILPKHVVPHYRWLGIAFGYLIIFAIADIDYNRKKEKILKGIITVATLLILVINIVYVYKDYYWAVKPETINYNILKGFDYVEKNIEPGDNVLITGLYDTEETIYKSIYYLKNRMNYECNINVLTIRNTDLNNWVKFTNVKEIPQDTLKNYDHIFLYSSDGKIKKHINLKKEKLDISKLDEIIYPKIAGYNKENMTLVEILDLGNMYQSIGKSDMAINTFKQGINMSQGKNAYPYYFTGNVYEAKGNYTKASEYYKKAVKIDNTNATFSDAAKRISKFQ